MLARKNKVTSTQFGLLSFHIVSKSFRCLIALFETELDLALWCHLLKPLLNFLFLVALKCEDKPSKVFGPEMLPSVLYGSPNEVWTR